MDIKLALFNRLSTDGTITSLVGNRIFADFNGIHSVYPYITYFVVSSQSEHNMGGVSNLVHSSVQMDIWGLKSTDVSAIYKQCKTLLDGQSGTWGGVIVDNATMENMLTTFLFPSDSSEEVIHKGSFEIQAWYRQS